MRYRTLDGRDAEGAYWSPGPKANTLWILPADGGRPTVVSSTRKSQKRNAKGTLVWLKDDEHGMHIEAEYEWPQYIPSHVPQLLQVTADIIECNHHLVARFWESGLKVIPASEEYTIARQVQDNEAQAQRSREPYINAHGGNAAVSDKTFQGLCEKDGMHLWAED
jgi:hypothetical protein